MTHPYPLALESSVAFGILHHVFFTEPSEAYLHQLFAEGLLQLWPEEFISPEDRAAHHAFSSDSHDFDKAYQDNLERDFARLFVGPERKLAYPWGSYYTDKYQQLNGDSTHALHTFLRSNAIELNLDSNELPDHIGLIFAVLSELFASEQWQQVQPQIQELMRVHLEPWVFSFTKSVCDNAQTQYYQHFAKLAEGIINHWLKELS